MKRGWYQKLAALGFGVILSLGFGVASFAADPAPSAPSDSPSRSLSGSPTRRVRIQEVWRQVYQQVPDLPLENQYVNRESGKVDPNNTLVTRLIRYHSYVAGRAPNYRLDWKLTLADYLGLNNIMDAAEYPGADTLRQNPFERDRAVIQRLNRKQRDALIQALVGVFSPAAAATPSTTP